MSHTSTFTIVQKTMRLPPAAEGAEDDRRWRNTGRVREVEALGWKGAETLPEKRRRGSASGFPCDVRAGRSEVGRDLGVVAVPVLDRPRPASFRKPSRQPLEPSRRTWHRALTRVARLDTLLGDADSLEAVASRRFERPDLCLAALWIPSLSDTPTNAAEADGLPSPHLGYRWNEST